MDKQINVNPPLGCTELIIRQGDAFPVKEPKTISFSGLLSAPRNYFESRKGLLNKDECHLIVDNYEGIIKFIVNEKSAYKDEISGKIQGARIIDEFKINKEHQFTDKELAKLFKMNEYYFVDKSLHTSIVKSLMNFSAKIEKVIEDHKDTAKGNYKKLIEGNVVSSVAEYFMMKAPLFEGYDPEEFKVFICKEASTDSVMFYLDSPDMYRMQEEIKRSIIHSEIKPFIEFGCPILQK